jgi:hypothetical protein
MAPAQPVVLEQQVVLEAVRSGCGCYLRLPGHEGSLHPTHQMVLAEEQDRVVLGDRHLEMKRFP